MLSLMFLVYFTKHSAHSENRDQRMRQVVAYKQWKIINRQAQKVVAVAYMRQSFTRGSNCKALTERGPSHFLREKALGTRMCFFNLTTGYSS